MSKENLKDESEKRKSNPQKYPFTLSFLVSEYQEGYSSKTYYLTENEYINRVLDVFEGYDVEWSDMIEEDVKEDITNSILRK